MIVSATGTAGISLAFLAEPLVVSAMEKFCAVSLHTNCRLKHVVRSMLDLASEMNQQDMTRLMLELFQTDLRYVFYCFGRVSEAKRLTGKVRQSQSSGMQAQE